MRFSDDPHLRKKEEVTPFSFFKSYFQMFQQLFIYFSNLSYVGEASFDELGSYHFLQAIYTLS